MRRPRSCFSASGADKNGRGRAGAGDFFAGDRLFGPKHLIYAARGIYDISVWLNNDIQDRGLYMNRSEAYQQYVRSLKLGQKYCRSCMINGNYPYIRVLDELLDESTIIGRMNLGVMDIPSEQIVGTKNAERRLAFAANYMPLLSVETEFAAKWISLCSAHLSDEGIHDPISCYEYMGEFYVQEGHKRVSVMRSYGAPSVSARVVRLIPAYSDDVRVRVYYEFLNFYNLSKLYSVRFRRPGDYAKLTEALGYESDHSWTEAERQSFAACYTRFREVFRKLNREKLAVTEAEALLVWLRVYKLSDMKPMDAAELTKSIESVWAEIRLLQEAHPIAVETDPPEPEEEAARRGLLSRIMEPLPDHLNVAFVHAFRPESSQWTGTHDLGRQYLESQLGDQINVRMYAPESGQDASGLMERAVADGADVIFATAPPLIGQCLKTAALHPDIHVLNCSLSMPYASIRTYYCRTYEAKFITGAIAGAMCGSGRIGYVANYPILGVPASINAFALGARMTNPGARIALRWSCVEDSPAEDFAREGISVISNRDAIAAGQASYVWDWGTYQRLPDGSLIPLASPCWDWGKFYERVVRSIMDGTWGLSAERAGERAVNYWWGMRSGVIDVQLSDSLPAGVRQLAGILKKGLRSGFVDPFHCAIRDQQGREHNDGSLWLRPYDVMNMDWLCDNVDGRIPTYDELLPMSHALVRQLGLYRDEIPPAKEEKAE